MLAARKVASTLQETEIERDKQVAKKEEELQNKIAQIAIKEEAVKQEQVNLDRQKKELSEAQSKLDQERKNFESEKVERERLFKQQKNDYEAMQHRVTAGLEDGGDQATIQVDVGGKPFRTLAQTLCRFRDSTLAQLVIAKPANKDHPGTVFIDRDGENFQFILNYLRSGDEDQLICSVARFTSSDKIYDILEEAKYYNLRHLVKVLQWALVRQETPRPIIEFEGQGTSCGLVTKEPPPGEALNLRGRNFTDHTFDQVRFAHPTSFEGSVLERAVFNKCKFEAAVSFIDTDLRRAKFCECEFPVRIIVTGANKNNATGLPADALED